MNEYFFRLICVDENNPLEYPILVDETLENLDAVHKFMDEHISEHRPDYSKWQLFLFKKSDALKMIQEPK